MDLRAFGISGQGAPGRRFTRSAPGSVTFVSRSTGQPWKTARPLTRMGKSRGTADPRGAHRPAARRDKRWADKVAFRKGRQRQCQRPWPGFFWRCFYTHTCGEWNLSFRNKCWKCSSKKGQAVEVVLGVPDPVADERSESEGSESDREEHTADRIAEKLGLTQFLRRRNKKRGGREGIPGQRQLPSAAAVEVAVQAPEAQQDSLLVSSLCRWGRPPL